MNYKVIEKTDFGIRVRNYSEMSDCNLCKNVAEKNICNRIECAPNSYYLPDSEVEKLESELTPETFTINDMYVESKLLFDCQDQLKDLQIENNQLKERIKELEATIENMKAIAINLQQPIQGYTTTSVDLIDDNTTELISELEDYYGLKTNILKTKCCGIAPITTENYCPNCGRKIIRK